MRRWTSADVVAYDDRAPDPEDTEKFTAALGCFWGPDASFTLGEPYHQTFNLSGKRWATDAFDDAGYGRADVRESPAAAKLNAVLAGRDVPDLGALGGRTTRDADRSVR